MEIDEGKAKVIKYFIKNTPIGEFNEVLKELQAMIGSDAVHSEIVADYLLETMSDHCVVANHEGVAYQLTTIGRNGNQFFDPKHSCTFDVNPFDLSVSNVAPVTSGTTLSRLIQEKLDAYLLQHFSETAQGRVFQNDEAIFLVISCANVNLRNMWTGEWIGDWKVVEGKIEGSICVNAHYFEEGNLQMKQKKEFSKSISGTNEETWAEAIIKAIKDYDNIVQNGMNEVYDNLPSNVFRPMRRTMPVTSMKYADMVKTKMCT